MEQTLRAALTWNWGFVRRGEDNPPGVQPYGARTIRGGCHGRRVSNGKCNRDVNLLPGQAIRPSITSWSTLRRGQAQGKAKDQE